MGRIDHAHYRSAGPELDLIAAEERDGAGDTLAVDQCAVEALQIGDRELFAGPANFGGASRADRRGDLLSVDERATARVAVGHEASALAQAKLGVLARDHRPLLGRKEVVALGRIAANAHNFTGESALAREFAAAILCENNLHRN